MNIETLINEHYDHLNENDQHIAKYIINHEEECKYLSIIQLAEVTLTSKSSILRFTQKLGFSGYSEFKYALKQQKLQQQEQQSFVAMQQEDLLQTAKIFSQQNVTPVLEAFDRADSIYCYGTGWGQRDVLKNFMRSVIPLQRFPIHLQSQKELSIVLDGSITEKDLMIVLSLSGENKPREDILNRMRLKNIPILSITNMSRNRLASKATYNLYYQSTEIGEDTHEIFSMMPLFQVMDLFYRAYVDYKQIDLEQL
ncbi:MurR/RpiR family transcriptional regulator [Tetragenococcus koreensis]|uniref:MurR/RpiR family transcriptional regulator n=1 Tax=Tetragenococcus koreensis TaxID=290335 RepID=UPI001F279E16|nr:MurR/RpiR family transcriptional regulator [Tetragenococcus koreensis]MDN6277511.1 MurR/RpiR family transcriptional regulator [Lactococcus lactis]MCF1617469.1 MurR/RpiR family transcriptional regulator [Tetragenococcus koreensis]MCF1619710.1 MurR/RpiR family transcriptional regulator [Tetragenococcus koreensis]MCF1622307.1 MurR/RpiR family transcriptional regulator [Tetragenococcus koreensis]MCF1627572.1 MurR/RpiR family transcriptional regulator [Tetragenococcus koreensis]